MKAVTLARLDPSIAFSVLAGCLVLGALVTSPILRVARLLLETIWLYLSNTR